MDQHLKRSAKVDGLNFHQLRFAPREKKTVEELETALAKALRAHPECQGIKILKITPLENSEDGLANWDAEFAAEPGVTMSAECKRVLLGAKQDVQKHFDLSDGD